MGQAHLVVGLVVAVVVEQATIQRLALPLMVDKATLVALDLYQCNEAQVVVEVMALLEVLHLEQLEEQEGLAMTSAHSLVGHQPLFVLEEVALELLVVLEGQAVLEVLLEVTQRLALLLLPMAQVVEGRRMQHLVQADKALSM